MKIQVSDFEIKNIDYRQLKPLQGDLKDLSKKNYAKLKKSFESKGMFVPLFVWQRGADDFAILDGHGRERLFSTEKPTFTRADGSETHDVPCLIIQAKDLKDAKEKLLIISSQYQEMTVEGFQEFTFDLDLDFMKDAMPFDDLLKQLDDPVSAEASPEDDPEVVVPEDPTTKPGDLYQLGEHFLLCGDSSDPEAIDALMDGQKASLVFTDPPYNAGGSMKSDLYKGTGSEAMKELSEVEWDKNFDIQPIFKSLEAAIAEDVTVYICTSHFLAGAIWEWMAANFKMYGYNVWVKPNPMPSLQKRHWTWATELICYASRGKHTFNFPAQGHALSFWSFKSRDGKRIHPTQKPISVPEHAIKHSSNPGDVVLDLFGGSGTTLISCELQGRKCRMIEMSRAYCDAIIFRWEAMTKRKAKLIKQINSIYEKENQKNTQAKETKVKSRKFAKVGGAE